MMKGSSSPVGSGLSALIVLLLAGCAGSRAPATVQYRPHQNETVYRARAIDLGTIFESGGLGQDPRVAMNSWALCDGENCHPREAWLSFSIRRAGKEMQLTADRSVSIETAEEVYSWKQDYLPGSRAPTHGEIARISLDLSTLEDLATTQRFRGTIGGEEFALSYEEREPLRALYEKAKASSAGS